MESSGALTGAIEAAAKNDGKHPLLNIAAEVVEQEDWTKGGGLGAALK